MGILQFIEQENAFGDYFIKIETTLQNDVTIQNLKSNKKTTFHWFQNNDYRLLIIFALKQMRTNSKVTPEGFEEYEKSIKVAIEKSNHAFLLEEIKDRMLAIDKLGEIVFSAQKATGQLIASGNFWYFVFYGINDRDYQNMYAQHLIEEQYVTATNSEYFISYRFSLKNISNFKTKQIFFISEFGPENDLTNKQIKLALEVKGFKVILINEDHKFGNIDFAIKKYITESQFVLCNLDYFKTDHWNANVFFELGMAHGLNKPTIMFIGEDKFPGGKKATSKELPFDINSHTCLKLENGNVNQLIQEIENIIS